MNIQLTSNISGVAEEIENLAEQKDRVAMYNSMTLPAAKVLLQKFEEPGAYFNDFTGNLRESGQVLRGNRRRVTTLRFNAPHAHLVDAGNQVWEGTDFVARLINENLDATVRAALRGGEVGWERFGKRIRRLADKKGLVPVR